MVVLRIVTMARANVNLVLNGMLENAQVTNTDLKKIASKIHQLFAHISLTFSGIQQNPLYFSFPKKKFSKKT